ncbi:MAG TPA: type 4a pilus biogenesis protein PilO [Candidatus Paceibacterota bacterium]
MKGSTKRALSLLLTGALIIGAFVVYASLIRPEYAAIQEKRAILKEKTDMYNRQSAAITQLEQLEQSRQRQQQQQAQLASALPSRENVAEVVGQLQAIAQATGVTIQGVGLEYLPIRQNADEAGIIKGIGGLRLNVKLFSPYESFKKFLESLETNIRIMDLTNAHTEHAGRPEQNLFIHTLTVDTYYQAQ